MTTVAGGTSPAPFTPPGCDLRDFHRMPLDVARLFGSTFNAMASRQPIAWMVGVKLWSRSWHQVPAASLPGDDEALCHLAELGLDLKTFRKARPLAMHGWVLCGDDRHYHPVIAELALVAWLDKLNQRLSGGAGNAQRWGVAFDPAPLQSDINTAAALLAVLNPQSPALVKNSRRASAREAKGNAK